MHLFCRDLAARNCLIDKKGRIKVADFGLSRSLQPDEEYFVQIKEVPVRWWAVEVFSNSPYTNKCDVWSYGVTIWEVFSKADTPYSLIQHNNLVIDAVKHGKNSKFSEFLKISIDLGERLKQPDKCPSKLYAIMTSCWAFQPNDRPNFEKLVELLKKEKPLF
jgi:AXL receptor tyrosine kinase